MKKLILLILSLLLLSFRTTDDKEIYDKLKLGEVGLNKQAFEYAYIGYQKILEQGKIENKDYLIINGNYDITFDNINDLYEHFNNSYCNIISPIILKKSAHC